MVVALLVALLVAGVFAPSVNAFGWVIAGVAAFTAMLIAAQIPRWHCDRHFDERDLRPTLIFALCAESAATTALFTVGMVVRSPDALVCIAIGLLLFIAVCDIVVATQIRERGLDEADRSCAEHEPLAAGRLEQAPLDRRPASDAEVPTSAQHEKSSSPRTKIVELSADAWVLLASVGMCLSRRIAPIAVVAVIGVGVTAAGGHLSKPGDPSPNVAGGHGSESGTKPDPNRGKETPGKAAKPDRTTTGDTSSTPKPPTSPEPWNGPCGSPPKSKVSADAVARMLRLFNFEARLEPRDVGCIGLIEPHSFPHDYYVTTAGVESPTGETLSFAVYSERYGGVIVLKDAQTELQTLIKEVGPVGGVGRYPRYFVGPAGDYYLLRSPRGMFVLIREKENEDYQQLPPGLARAWYLLMVTLKTWLWPSHPLPDGDGKLIYKLWSPRDSERPEAEVVFDPSTKIARCSNTNYKPLPSFELSLTELVELADKA